MSKVRILVAMAMTAIASGAAVSGINVSVSDASGAIQTANVNTTDFPAPASDGTFQVEVDFDGIATGAFTGAVQAFDDGHQPMGDPVSYTGTATNLQPMPVSVTVAFA